MRHVLKLDSLKGKRICFGQQSLASEPSGEVRACNSWEAAAKRDMVVPPYPNSQALDFNTKSL